ncbi:MAG: branched-chain amino acid ABC transporter permease, partial [Rhodoplanes sp.]
MAQAWTRCGDFKTSYRADTTIFPSSRSRVFALIGIALAIAAPLQVGGVGILSDYWITLLIQIGYLAVAAL